jgi:beta-ketodecanoyl-[acyl-carrier-protein] synthase
MKRIAISGTGLFTPPESVSNEELVAAFNTYVENFNRDNADKIARGETQALQASSTEFIVKASGIKSRHVVDRKGLVDAKLMRPQIRRRPNEEVSLSAEMGIKAAQQALQRSGRQAADVDVVLVACTDSQRPYPAIAVEIQHHLGTGGYANDMSVACASAAFGIQAAADAVRNGSARAALVISPEICSPQLNYRDRDSHFIFGDAATAVLIEPLEHASGGARGEVMFEILGTRLKTQFSNNIRSNFGFLNASEVPPREPWDLLFVQEGRKVFKEVVPMVSELILQHLGDLGLTPAQVKRFWLHQANLNMNLLIAKRVLGREPSEEEAPVILDEYANTSSAGSVIAFHKHQQDFQRGEVGVLCAFGAGYSAGSVVLKRV